MVCVVKRNAELCGDLGIIFIRRVYGGAMCWSTLCTLLYPLHPGNVGLLQPLTTEARHVWS